LSDQINNGRKTNLKAEGASIQIKIEGINHPTGDSVVRVWNQGFALPVILSLSLWLLI